MTGNADTATSVSGAQTGITSVGTLSGLQISNGGKIGSVGDDDAMVMLNGKAFLVKLFKVIYQVITGNLTGILALLVN